MRIRLLSEDEEPVALPIGDSTLHVRRLSTLRLREIEAKRRRQFKRLGMNGDADQVAAYLQAIEDDKLDAAIVRWEGIEGEPPCTRENKLLLPAAVRQAVFVLADSAVLPRDEEAERNFAWPSATSAPSELGSVTASS